MTDGPAHLAPPTRVERTRRIAFWTLGIVVAVMVATGVWEALEYEPGDALASVHAVLGVVALLAALVGAIATVVDDERSTAGLLPAIILLTVIAGLYLTGPTLAWDQVVASGPAEAKGVTVAFDDDVGGLTKGTQFIQSDDYQRVAWLHVAALPFLLLVMAGGGIWAARRIRRDDEPLPGVPVFGDVPTPD